MGCEAYCGATARVTLRDALALGSGWAAQPKKDGVFCTVHLDAEGRIDRLLSRTGRVLPPVYTHDLVGLHAGPGHAVLAGELEAETEAGRAAVAARGYPLVHLFDYLHDGARSLATEPQRVRRDALHRMQAACEVGARLPIVPQYSVAQVGRWYAEALDAGDEVLVLVHTGAPVGARACKLKLKRLDTLDGVVGSVDARCLWVSCPSVAEPFAVSLRKSVDTVMGAIVEVAHEGFYASGVPRFPRVVRRRYDLEPPERQLELDDLPGDLVARLRGGTDVEPWRRPVGHPLG